MQRRKKRIPQLNSSSTADMAFLLLIFFLITSSFDSMTGIYRKMTPMQAEEILKKKQDIEGRNLLEISIDDNNAVLYNDKNLTLPELRNMVKTFIDNPDNVDFLPQKEEKDIPEIGTCKISSKHTISLEISRKANYQTYLSVLNEMTAAYNELRNDAAKSLFHKPFNRLTKEQQEAVREIYPQHIFDKDPEGGEP